MWYLCNVSYVNILFTCNVNHNKVYVFYYPLSFIVLKNKFCVVVKDTS